MGADRLVAEPDREGFSAEGGRRARRAARRRDKARWRARRTSGQDWLREERPPSRGWYAPLVKTGAGVYEQEGRRQVDCRGRG